MAAAAERRGQRAWVYRFSRIRPGPGGHEFLAYHGAEIPYVFNTHDAWMAGDADDAALTTVMMDYWARFARSGDPNSAGVVAWPAFSAAEPRIIDLGTRVAARAAPDSVLCSAIAPQVYPGWTR
ncbi:MAG: carboxylesterase family protein, partial [Deltaproteobacteria bacterium]